MQEKTETEDPYKKFKIKLTGVSIRKKIEGWKLTCLKKKRES